jgi:uncharacterized LabA/DUF88 family protein
MAKVAVYWDFENIHASLCTRSNGASWYRDNLFTKQPHLVDINSIMQYVVELGDVNINRAYANWSFFHAYSYDLQNHSVDLIQLYPRGRYGKNGADIRMSIDIVEDLANNAHIDRVVLVGGDSDYISVAQKVRQKGKNITGIGVQETTNQYWVKSCNEFKFYSSLLVKSSRIEDLEAEGYEIADIDSAKALLRRAVETGLSGSGQDFILKAALKPLIQRFEPSFDESNYGFRSFTSFLEQCTDIVEITPGEHDHVIRLQGLRRPDAGHDGGNGNGNGGDGVNGNRYEGVLRKLQVRMVPAPLLEQSVREAFAILHGEEINNLDFKQLLAQRMSDLNPDFTSTDATKVRALLYKSVAFRHIENNRTTLIPEVHSADELLHRVHFAIVRRILDNITDEQVDTALLSALLFGEDAPADAVAGLIAEYNALSRDH